MSQTYLNTRDRLETYFNKTASKTWEALTSDAPVSRIRQTVRAGRDNMRAELLSHLPQNLSGATILDAGCGAGQMCVELARRGANVVGVDISPSLLEVAKARTPDHLTSSIIYRAGDMLATPEKKFDFVVSMDSLIHYEAKDIVAGLTRFAALQPEKVVFTIAPKNAALVAMHTVGKLFPKKDRSPAIVPTGDKALITAASEENLLQGWDLRTKGRIKSGFYISQAMELAK